MKPEAGTPEYDQFLRDAFPDTGDLLSDPEQRPCEYCHAHPDADHAKGCPAALTAPPAPGGGA